MGVNLLRNARVFFTTNVNADTGKINTTAASGTNANTFEIQVLDGFSFSQGTTAETVTLNEAGSAPVRGQRSFNTALNPVDFSFSTYLRPCDSNDTASAPVTGGFVTSEERCLWNAMFSNKAIGTTGAAWLERGATSAATFTIYNAGTGYVGAASTGTTYYSVPLTWSSGGTVGDITEYPIADITVNPSGQVSVISIVDAGVGITSAMKFTTSNSNLGGAGSGLVIGVTVVTTSSSPAKVVTNNSQVHQLQKFGMIVVFDDTTFFIENCTLDTATIDFGLDAIATIAWTGKATALTTPSTTITFGGTASSTTGGTMAGGYSAASFKPKITYAPYIANKLSTMTLKSGINAEGTSTTYTLALTGGNITISNNVTYLTPANLGIVNQPCTYFTGTRSVTGNVTAYLRGGSGANYTATLLSDMLSSTNITNVNPAFELVIAMGGAANATRVEFDLSAAVVQIPTIATEQVISTTINFTAQGYTPVSNATDTFDITASNELEVRYYAPIA
jgi:hypothetical protein